jgi:hypothetical protein
MKTALELLQAQQADIRTPTAAEGGKIKLLREALDTAEAARAFSKD